MKTAKTLLSVLLALTLVLALGTSAYAAGSITVSDPGTYSYEAYKIFDAAVDPNDSSKVIYTLEANSEWAGVLIDATKPGNAADGLVGLTFTHVDADSTATPPVTEHYVVNKGNSFSAADFADFLRGTGNANLTGKTPIALSGDPMTSGAIDDGYYLVLSKDNGVYQDKAALTTVLGGNVNVENKNDMPFDKEIVTGSGDEKEDGVQIGDTVNFKITGKVPEDIATYTSYIYLVTDTMDNGLTFTGPVTVTVGGTAVTLTEVSAADQILGSNEVRYNANNKSFELSLDLVGKTANDPIVITYSAVVNANAAGTITENNAVLEYGHDPDSLTVKDSQAKVYTSKLIIDKYENGAPEQKLSGAKFVLRKTGTHNYYYLSNGTASWVTVNPDTVSDLVTASTGANPTITAITTNDNGAAVINGLADGSYELIEIEAPVGYTRVETPIAVLIDGSASTAVGLSDAQVAMALTNVVNVANTPGTNLPSTGGIGTTIFYLVGAVLLIGAVVVLIVRKRQSSES